MSLTTFSSWAIHPQIAIIKSLLFFSFSCLQRPKNPYNLSWAFSRIAQVFKTTTSAVSIESVLVKPNDSKRAAISSPSWTFIWQPYVSMQ